MKVIHETSRLLLAEADLVDAHFIFELMNSPGWIQYIGDRGIKSLKDAENYIQSSLIDKYQKLGFGLYKMCLKADGTPIGLCGFVQRDYLDAPDLGFAVLPKYEGKGFVFEASQMLLNLRKEQVRQNEVYAITSLSNERSQRLLTILGFIKKSTINPAGTELALFQINLIEQSNN